MNISVIITAGGSSSRFGKTNKLLEKIDSKELIIYTLKPFIEDSQIGEIIICANNSIIKEIKQLFSLEKKVRIIPGGDTRQQSVLNGLNECSEDCDYVLIHDGARPMISKEIIAASVQKVKEKKAITVATKTIDTIKQVDIDGKIIKTIDRSALYNTQTPQAFEFALIKKVHLKLKGQNFTDDAGMAEAFGHDVYIVEGDYKNIKVTTKNDLDIARTYLMEM